jgi:hypothetical protein
MTTPELPASPRWNTPAFWVTVLTGALGAGATALTTFVHTPFDRSSLAPLVPSAAVVVAGLVTFVYVHGAHKVAVAHVAADAQLRAAAIAAGAATSTLAVRPVNPTVDIGSGVPAAVPAGADYPAMGL